MARIARRGKNKGTTETLLEAFRLTCEAAPEQGRRWVFAGKANVYGDPERYTALYAQEGSPHKAVILIHADSSGLTAKVELLSPWDGRVMFSQSANRKHPAPPEIEQQIATEPRPSWCTPLAMQGAAPNGEETQQ